jgi:hypothetical protein
MDGILGEALGRAEEAQRLALSGSIYAQAKASLIVPRTPCALIDMLQIHEAPLMHSVLSVLLAKPVHL